MSLDTTLNLLIISIVFLALGLIWLSGKIEVFLKKRSLFLLRIFYVFSAILWIMLVVSVLNTITIDINSGLQNFIWTTIGALIWIGIPAHQGYKKVQLLRNTFKSNQELPRF